MMSNRFGKYFNMLKINYRHNFGSNQISREFACFSHGPVSKCVNIIVNRLKYR